MAVEDAEDWIRDAIPDHLKEPTRTYVETKSDDDRDVIEAFLEVQSVLVEQTVRLHHEGRLEAKAQLARLVARDARTMCPGKLV